MDAVRFRGSTVALVTPFDKRGELDEPRLRGLVERQIGEGTDVILAVGTTGESATLSAEEQSRVAAIVVGQSAGRRPVLCGAGSYGTREAVALALQAEQIGADGILSVAPYYNKPTQEGLYQHFRAIAESTRLPMILYNVPGRTGCNLSAATTLRLAEIPNIIGIKEASGNLSQIMQILLQRPKSFLVLSGDDALAFPLMALGADGVVSVVANQVPGEMRDMTRAALEGDWSQARRIHYRFLALMEANFLESNPIPVKTSLAMMGLIEENFRLPLVRMKDENRVTLRKVMAELALI